MRVSEASRHGLRVLSGHSAYEVRHGPELSDSAFLLVPNKR